MKTKLLLIPLALSLVISLAVVGCGEAEAEVIELIFNDHNPPGTGPAQAYDYWAEKVEEESEGREAPHG